jgi:hypothetical protein
MEMQTIGETANRHFEGLKASLDAGDAAEIGRHADIVKSSVEAFDSIADQFAWPFSKNLITRFGSIMAAIGALALSKLFNFI